MVCDTGVSVPVRGVEGEERSSAGVEREEGVSRAVSPGEMVRQKCLWIFYHSLINFFLYRKVPYLLSATTSK